MPEIASNELAGREAGAVPACERSTRLRALAPLLRAVAAATSCATIAACGGGAAGEGGSGAFGTPPPPPPPPAVIPAVMSVPDPVGYDPDRLAAFQRLNSLRLAAGLGMLAQNPALDQAAQAHGDWMELNGIYDHVEIVGTPGFTGVTPAARAAHFGFVVSGGGEVLSGAGLNSEAEVDGLVNVIYHREALLGFSETDLGIGFEPPRALPFGSLLTMETSGNGQVRQTAQARMDGIVVWPADGATGVPTSMGHEDPNPVPGIDVGRLGTPASLGVDYWKNIEVQTFTMTAADTGLLVPCTLLTAANDVNRLLAPDFVGLVPNEALRPGTTYRVDFQGRVDGVPAQRSWRFATAMP